jgi:hypothetical protein
MKTEIENQPEVEGGFGCLTPNYGFDRIKADPQLLGRFLAACAALKPLEREARDAATAFALAGRPVPNCQLVDDRYLTAVSAEAIIEAAHDLNSKRHIEKLKSFIHLVGRSAGHCTKVFAKRSAPRCKSLESKNGQASLMSSAHQETCCSNDCTSRQKPGPGM